jgi:hypothetical protein
MTFSMKPQIPVQTGQSSSQVPDEAWAAWNEYYWSLFDGKEVQATKADGEIREGIMQKRKKYVAICKGIADLGLQPQQDASYEWKGVAGKGDQLSDEEKAHVEKYPDNYFKDVDGKRMQFKPERPTQEFALYFDIPKVEIDWTKHPLEALHHLGVKPLRVCFNGYVKIDSMGIEDMRKHLRFNPNFRTGKLSPNSPLMKMANSLNIADEYSKEYDIGVFANQACNVTLVAEKGERFFNEIIVEHSEISDVEVGDNVIKREDQIPECHSDFYGVLLNGGDYSDDIVSWVSHRKELMCVLPRAKAFQPNAVKAPDFWLGCNWEDSDLKKALDAKGANIAQTPSNPQQEARGEEKPSQASKPVQKEEKPSESDSSSFEDDDWSDSIPF